MNFLKSLFSKSALASVILLNLTGNSLATTVTIGGLEPPEVESAVNKYNPSEIYKPCIEHGIKNLTITELEKLAEKQENPGFWSNRAKENQIDWKLSDYSAGKANIVSKYKRDFETLRWIDPDIMREINQVRQINFWVNFYNATAIYLLVNYPLDALFGSIYRKHGNVKSSNSYVRYERFFKDNFFTKEYLDFPNIGKLSLNDIAYGILGGDFDYINELKDRGILLKAFHEAIYPEGEIPYVEPLFLLISGHNVTLTMYDFIELLPYFSVPVSPYDADMDDVLKGSIDVVGYVLNRSESPYRREASQYGLLCYELPYVFSLYRRIIEFQYGSIDAFLLKYMPDDDPSKPRLADNLNNLACEIRFIRSTRLLKLTDKKK